MQKDTNLMAKQFTTEEVEALNECAPQQKVVIKPGYRGQMLKGRGLIL